MEDVARSGRNIPSVILLNLKNSIASSFARRVREETREQTLSLRSLQVSPWSRCILRNLARLVCVEGVSSTITHERNSFCFCQRQNLMTLDLKEFVFKSIPKIENALSRMQFTVTSTVNSSVLPSNFALALDSGPMFSAGTRGVKNTFNPVLRDVIICYCCFIV